MMLRLNIWLWRHPKKFCQLDEEKSFEKEVGKDSSNYRNAAQELISKDPGLSLTKLAKTVGVSDITMHRIAKENLCFKSYVIKV